MIISRLGPDEWRKEWIEEVQGLLERDAGWGWRGFWKCVRMNLDVRFLSLPYFSMLYIVSFDSHLLQVFLPSFAETVNHSILRFGVICAAYELVLITRTRLWNWMMKDVKPVTGIFTRS
jgi:hypothetical protein